jgi:hypothetical protein
MSEGETQETSGEEEGDGDETGDGDDERGEEEGDGEEERDSEEERRVQGEQELGKERGVVFLKLKQNPEAPQTTRIHPNIDEVPTTPKSPTYL